MAKATVSLAANAVSETTAVIVTAVARFPRVATALVGVLMAGMGVMVEQVERLVVRLVA